MTAVTATLRDDICIITVNNPPVNALGAAVRQGLDEALGSAEADTSVKAIVLACAGSTFFAGADISEFGRPQESPALPDLVERIEATTKPVVAAIHGTALGGGCEVAMACHYRIAAPSASLGLPEVNLGLLPGAGGTQRLPRLVGLERALEMTVSGAPVSAPRALDIGLIDELAEGSGLLEAALDLAARVADLRPLPRASERAVLSAPETVEAFRLRNSRLLQGAEAPKANLQCVEAAARLPFAAGLVYERNAFNLLLEGDESKALRHLFFAQRLAPKIEGLAPGTAPRPIKTVGVVGAGTMGTGIAMNFLSAGIPVTIVERDAAALERGMATVRTNYESAVRRGRLASDKLEPLMALLNPALEMERLAECDLVIEAVFEDLDLKKAVFGQLDLIAKPGAILATNTSFLDVDAIAGATSRPGDVLGLHFFSPAHLMQLLEVVRGHRTSDDVLATALLVAKAIRKTAVVAGVCHGFIGNRMLWPRQTEAIELLLEGATPEQVDQVHTAFGMPMGPFQMSDLAGVDIGWHRDSSRIESLSDALCAEGRLGQKSGAGYYDYDDRRAPSPSERVATIVSEFRARSGRTPREISEGEILERTIYPMVNEGAKILAEGIAQRASDIDVVWTLGYGWPKHTGGPMHWAEQQGLSRVLSTLERLEASFGPRFSPSPLLRKVAGSQAGFSSPL